jgi:hypothetical protein
MLISEILNWNNHPAEEVRPGPQLDLPPSLFSDDPTNLANAFTRDGKVKHFWNLGRSEGQPRGPVMAQPVSLRPGNRGISQRRQRTL